MRRAQVVALAASSISRVTIIESGRSVHLQRQWLPIHRFPSGVRVCCIDR